jgi:DNA-binding NarL/FixJ family response regulator
MTSPEARIRALEKVISQDLHQIGLRVDQTIGRHATNQMTRSALRDIRVAIDDLASKLHDLSRSDDLLTRRESQILHALATGKTAAAIGVDFSISEPTVKTHLASIYRKLHVTNKTSALSQARKLGLLTK